MIARRLALLLLFVAPLSGCAQKVGWTDTATIVIEGLPREPTESRAILIDSSLNPEIDETHRKGFFWDTQQRVVLNCSVPMKLVRAAPDGPNLEKVATTHTATIVTTNGIPLRGIGILIDRSLDVKTNTRRDAQFSRWPKDVNQEILIRSHVPLKLVPLEPGDLDEIEEKWAPCDRNGLDPWRNRGARMY